MSKGSPSARCKNGKATVIVGNVFTKLTERDYELNDVLSAFCREMGCTDFRVDQRNLSIFNVLFNSKREALRLMTQIYDKFGKANLVTVGSKTTMSFDHEEYSIKHSILMNVNSPKLIPELNEIQYVQSLFKTVFTSFCSSQELSDEFHYVLIPRDDSKCFVLFFNMGRAKLMFLNWVATPAGKDCISSLSQNRWIVEFRPTHRSRKRKRKKKSDKIQKRKDHQKSVKNSLKSVAAINKVAATLNSDIEELSDGSDFDVTKFETRCAELNKRLKVTTTHRSVQNPCPSVENARQYRESFQKTRSELLESTQRAIKNLQAVDASVQEYKEDYESALKNSTRFSSSTGRRALTRDEKSSVDNSIQSVVEKGNSTIDKLKYLFDSIAGWINDASVWEEKDGIISNENKDGTISKEAEAVMISSGIQGALLNFHPDRLSGHVLKEPVLMYRIERLRHTITELKTLLSSEGY